MNENIIKQHADFVFIQSGDVYIIEKDRYGILRLFVAVDEITAYTCLAGEYKTEIKNARGEVIMKNFKDVDLKAVQELLGGIEQAYDKRLELVADIDKALDEGNKALFMELTEQLKQLDGGINSEHGVA